MATHLSIHVWRIPCLVDYSARGRKESDTTERLSLSLFCYTSLKMPRRQFMCSLKVTDSLQVTKFASKNVSWWIGGPT